MLPTNKLNVFTDFEWEQTVNVGEKQIFRLRHFVEILFFKEFLKLDILEIDFFSSFYAL